MIRTIPFNFTSSINKKHIYTGVHPAITGIGGFSVEEEFQSIRLNPIQNIGKYNLSDSIQLLFDVNAFNRKLGLVKNHNNIIRSTYSSCTGNFPVDSISITSADFIHNLQTVEQINSIGKLEYIYKEFIEYVNDFLNYEEGFTSIYILDEQFDISGGKYKIDDFYNLIKSTETNAYGTYHNLFGNITINGINKLLKSATELNIFGNRGIDEHCQTPYIYSIKDGFLDGDLIFIPKGFTISLSLDLDSETLKLNDLGKKHVKELNQSTNIDNGNMSQETITTMNNITRIIKVPLFIKLINDPFSINPTGPTGCSPPYKPTGHTGCRPPHKPTGHTGPTGCRPPHKPTGHTGPTGCPPHKPILPNGPTGNIIPPGIPKCKEPSEHSSSSSSDTSSSSSSDTSSSSNDTTHRPKINCFSPHKNNHPHRQIKKINLTSQLLNGKLKNNELCVKKNGNLINIFINNSMSDTSSECNSNI